MRLVLLHGLSRVRESMGPIGAFLRNAGHEVHLVHYPSRAGRLVDHARRLQAALVGLGLDGGGGDVGFVAHSLGGLVLRALARERPDARFGRSVVFGAPMLGSVLVDALGHLAWARRFVGPSFDDLRPTSVAGLPAVPAPLLSIAGTTSHPLVPTTHLLRRVAGDRPSDSLVLVDETRAPGATHLELPGVHFLLPRNPAVHRAIAEFLD